MSSVKSETGRWPLAERSDARLLQFCEIAGILAEHGVQAIEITDPLACRAWTVRTRATDLPRTLMDATPGTVLSCDGCSLLLTGTHMEWSATPAVAESLSKNAGE